MIVKKIKIPPVRVCSDAHMSTMGLL